MRLSFVSPRVSCPKQGVHKSPVPGRLGDSIFFLRRRHMFVELQLFHVTLQTFRILWWLLVFFSFLEHLCTPVLGSLLDFDGVFFGGGLR
jgi:hypothetical protein